MEKLVHLCGSRDYHAYDWYSLGKEVIKDKEVLILTDLVKGEGFIQLTTPNDKVHHLLVIDNILFRRPNKFGDFWRNFVKLAVLPIQVALLMRFKKIYPNCDYHAHGMYYIVLAALSGVSFVGTPQGSEILVRPYRSTIYKKIASWAMQRARALTVDSIQMQQTLRDISGRKAQIIQNGIDIEYLRKFDSLQKNEDYLLSIRGLTPLYRIKDIFTARKMTEMNKAIKLIYPFADNQYKTLVYNNFENDDEDIGRVSKNKMYDLMSKAYLVISIPSSDSSPRSVYEAIFCGCYVVVSENRYLDALPHCMKARIFAVRPDSNKNWLSEALLWREEQMLEPYVPSKKAIELFDQRNSLQLMRQKVYL